MKWYSWSIYIKNFPNLTTYIVLKPGFLLRSVDCCERGFIIICFNGHLVSEFYQIRYPFRLRIRTRSWFVLLLEFSHWPPSGIALIYFSTSKSLNWYEELHLLICSLSEHRPEEARVLYLEICGALNRRSIRGITQFLLVIQSVQLQNPQ